MRPASPRRGNVPMEGATPAGGGKPSAAVFRQACLVEKRRARFWEYALPEGHRRRRPLGCCVSRPRRPRSRGKSVGNAKHTSTADEHTLKGDRPAERKDKQGTMEAHSMQRARRGGGGSPNLTRWRNAKHNAHAPAPRVSPSPKASPKVWPDRRSPPKAVARGLRTRYNGNNSFQALSGLRRRIVL